MSYTKTYRIVPSYLKDFKSVIGYWKLIEDETGAVVDSNCSRIVLKVFAEDRCRQEQARLIICDGKGNVIQRLIFNQDIVYYV